MRLVRHLVPALVSCLIWAVPLNAQDSAATITGRVVDGTKVTVTAGATATVQFSLTPQAAILEAVVVTGYGTQRREAITGSVSAIDASAADVGVVTNVNQMLQGRAAGVTVIANNGEPGAGAQVRIRGGTSISASNEPLYVVDGVIIQNEPTEGRFAPAATQPAEPDQPLGHRVHHGAQRRRGDGHLRQPRGQWRRPDRDQESQLRGRGDDRV